MKTERFVNNSLCGRSVFTRAYLESQSGSIERDFGGGSDGVDRFRHVQVLYQSIICQVLVDLPPRDGPKGFKERHVVVEFGFTLDRGRGSDLEGVESAQLYILISFWGSPGGQRA